MAELLMHDLYTQEDAEIVFVGASRYYRGIDPEVVDRYTNKKSLNIGSSAQTTKDTYYMLKEMFKTNSPKYVVIDVNRRRLYDIEKLMSSQALISNTKMSTNKISWLTSIHNYEDYYNALFPGFFRATPEYIFSKEPSKNIKQKTNKRYREYDYDFFNTKQNAYKGRGYIYTERQYKEGQTGKKGASEQWDVREVHEDKLVWLEKAVELCYQHDAKVLFASMPVAYGNMHGNYQNYLDYANAYSQQLGIDFADFNLVKKSKFQRKDTYFYDRHHMNVYGSELFGETFGQYIRDDLNGSLKKEEYLHSTFQELLDDSPFLFSTWYEYDEVAGDIKAHYNSGTIKNGVEYQYSYNTKEDKEYKVYREYSSSPYGEVDKLPEDVHQIKLETREVNSGEEEPQFFIGSVRKFLDN